MATDILTCARDGAPTQLTCAGCETPICPRCLVRTPVGLKCASCSGLPQRRGGSRWIVPVTLAAGAAVVVAAVIVVSARGDRPRPGSPALAPASTLVAPPDESGADQATDGRLTFAVTGWECGATAVGSPGVNPLGQFCFLSFTVRNEGTAPDRFPGAFQYVIDDTGKRYGSDQKATQAYPAPGNRTLLDDHQINPGLTLEGVIVYDVPRGVKLVAAEFHRNPKTIGRRIDLPG